MAVRFNASDSVPFGTACDFDGFLNAADVPFQSLLFFCLLLKLLSYTHSVQGTVCFK